MENKSYLPAEEAEKYGHHSTYVSSGRVGHVGGDLLVRKPVEEINALCGLDGFEVYNHGSQVNDNNGESQEYWARYLNNGSHAYAVATDDNHCGYDENGVAGPGNNTLGGYICISMPELTYDNFIDAFRNGRFYASTGVEIKELYIDEETDELVLSCSPVRQAIVKGVHTVPTVRLNGYGDEKI